MFHMHSGHLQLQRHLNKYIIWLYQFFNCVQPFIIFYTRLRCANRIYNPKRNELVARIRKWLLREHEKEWERKPNGMNKRASTHNFRERKGSRDSHHKKNESHKNNQIDNLLRLFFCLCLTNSIFFCSLWIGFEFIVCFSHSSICNGVNCVKIDCWSRNSLTLIRQLF